MFAALSHRLAFLQNLSGLEVSERLRLVTRSLTEKTRRYTERKQYKIMAKTCFFSSFSP